MKAIAIDRGDRVREDFRNVFATHATRVVRLARLLGAEDPEDLAQEAFLRLYEKQQRLDGDVVETAAYLNRTVVNLARDRHRRSTTGRRFRLLTRRDAETVSPSAEHVGLARSDRERVLAALDKLPPRRREAVVLRYWQDLPYAAIAAAMGIGIGAAKSAVSRGLDDLHTHLEDAR